MALATISVLGVDLGKNVCSVVGLDTSGAVVMRRKVRRETLIGLAEKLPPCVVGMEACCGAHHLGRMFAAHGHDVRLMSPEYVRPYVKAHKNDNRDAEGIAEAATRPTMRFVELKSQDQLDMQTLHRSRDRLVKSAYYEATTSPQPGHIYNKVLLACALAEVDDLRYFTAAAVRKPLRIIANRSYEIPNFARHLKDLSNPGRGQILQRVGEKRRLRHRISLIGCFVHISSCEVLRNAL